MTTRTKVGLALLVLWLGVLFMAIEVKSRTFAVLSPIFLIALVVFLIYCTIVGPKMLQSKDEDANKKSPAPSPKSGCDDKGCGCN